MSPSGSVGSGRSRAGARSTARDIERYAGLFAQRTKVMKSSAMRDLMALTEREDVISLAGGLPDTSTFPADSYASLMSVVAAQSCARALQYGPTEGLPETVSHACVACTSASTVPPVWPVFLRAHCCAYDGSLGSMSAWTT